MGAETQNETEEFSGSQWREIDDIIERFQGKPGALIPVLEEIQGITDYLPQDVLRHVAKKLPCPLSQVYGVVTFYSFFNTRPRGLHTLKICLGTACHVRGAARNMVGLESLLGVKPGECTEDRQFSFEVVRCLGACGLAPVIAIDEDTHKHVKPERLPLVLKAYEDRERGEGDES